MKCEGWKGEALNNKVCFGQKKNNKVCSRPKKRTIRSAESWGCKGKGMPFV